METVHELIEWAAIGIEILAVSVIVAAVVIIGVTRGTVRYLFKLGNQGASESYKRQLFKALLLAMELLVAADVVRTVAFETTLQNVSVLGLLIVVRTFLSWSMVVEMEGRWPWQSKAETTNRTALPETGG